MRLIIRLMALVSIVALVVIAGQTILPQGKKAEVAEEKRPLVRVASRSLGVGTFLDSTEAPFTEWDGSVQEGMVVGPVPDDLDVIGAVIISTIEAGQAILRSHLLLPGQDGFLAAVLRPGMRAVSVAVDPVSGNAGLIFPGDRVDVILTQTLSGRDVSARLTQRWASETILRDVRVLAVDQNIRADMTDRDPNARARTITLEVVPQDAEKVALASGLGKLSLSLRSLLVDEAATSAMAEGDDALGDGGHGDATPGGPTWASDVSAVIRSATSTVEPKDAPPTPRGVRVFRGKNVDDVK